MFANPVELLKTGVPAFLYLVQNNLQYIAVSNMSAATYQVTYVTSKMFATSSVVSLHLGGHRYQLKILSTAVMSVLILRKTITKDQWVALAILTAGVAAVQISSMPSSQVIFVDFLMQIQICSSRLKAQNRCPAAQLNAAPDPNVNLSVGLTATLAACCCSGLAGVYFEKILKKSEVSLWTRNVQLGLYSILIGMVAWSAEVKAAHRSSHRLRTNKFNPRGA